MCFHLLVYAFHLIVLCFSITSCGINYERDFESIINSLSYNKNYVFTITDSNSYLLYNQEAGLFSFLKNDLDKSLFYFSNAINYYKKLEESSKFSAKKSLTYSILSDTFLNYEGSDYEANLVHYYAGLAYLAKSELQKAFIEFKAVEEGQKFAEQNRQKKIISSENNVNALLYKYNLKSEDISSLLEQSNSLKADIRSNFLNANSLYLAGIVRELSKSYNDALVDYKQAYAIQPNSKYLLEDLYRLSLIYDKDYANTLVTHHKYLKSFPLQNFKHNTVYLIYEQGYIPRKVNYKLSISDVNNSLWLTVNIPVYQDTTVPNKNVKLVVPGTNLNVKAETITSIYKLAKNNLTENYPTILAKQIGKLATQIAVQSVSQSNKFYGKFNLLLGSISFFDSADLRSWRTLPSIVKTAKLTSNYDINQITIAVNENFCTIDLNLKNGEIAIVYMFDTGYHLYTKILYKSVN